MFLEDSEYRYAMDLYDGKTQKSPLLLELSEWFAKEFGLQLYGYLCDETNGLTRLRMILWDLEANRSMQSDFGYDKAKQRKVREQFAALCVKYNEHPEYQQGSKVFVGFETLEDEISKRTLREVSEEICNIQGYDIWKITARTSGVDIFFETEAQIEQHKNDGVCALLEQKITSIVQKQDTYHIFNKGMDIANQEFYRRQ